MARKNRLVIDSNLWISWLIGKKQTLLSIILTDENVEIFTSKEQVHELFEVIERSKFRKHFSEEILDQFKLFFVEALQITDVKIKVKASRDPKDDYLLALALSVKADFLLTGDNDLLIMKKFEGISILTITEYLDK
jgi:putative PIN family toxin of toxin-antitoxin system